MDLPPPDNAVPSSTQNRLSSGGLPLQVEKYRTYLDGMNLTEAQTANVLSALWSLLTAFVDLSFGVDSVHLALPPLQQVPAEKDEAVE